MKIILFEPQIPQNTGNIARTCAIIGAELVLVRPIGFQISNHKMKRSGLDYWNDVNLTFIDNLEHYLDQCESKFYFFSTKGKKIYTEVEYQQDDILIFGSESFGLPPLYHEKWASQFYKIPMKDGQRSLNLSNSAAIVAYEAMRQQSFVPLLN